MALSCCHINVRSLTANFDQFVSSVFNRYDVITISETWLNAGILDEIINLTGYRLYRCDRATGRGGGVAMYVRGTLKSRLVRLGEVRNSEQLWVSVKSSTGHFAIGSLYRPPSFSAVDFLGELESVLCVLDPEHDHLLLLGDLNIDLLDFENRLTKQLLNLLESFSLRQSVSEPTRCTSTSSKLLDIVAHSNNLKNVVSKVFNNCNISDHCLVSCLISTPKRKVAPFLYTFRDIKNMNNADFLADLHRMNFQPIFEAGDVNVKVDLLNQIVTSLFDFHAPIKTVKISKSAAPWLTGAIRLLMRERDKAFHRYNRTKNNHHWEYYKNLRNEVNYAIKREKAAYFQYKCRTATKANLWKDLRALNIMNNNSKVNSSVPSSLEDPHQINDYFLSNSNKITTDLDTLNFFKTNRKNESLDFSIKNTNCNEIFKTLMSIKSKSMGSDNISINMWLLCCPVILPVIEHIFNFIIAGCTYPELWKKSLVVPLPKNNNPQEFQDLRPISLLCVLSKAVEKIMDNQIRTFLSNHNILPKHQSGFRKGHSCTTALAKVTDDILCANDANKTTILILIDYSKAFDCIDHDLMVALLHYLGFSNNTTNLFASYLSIRQQAVRTSRGLSSFKVIYKGVPQGSVLGPLLFTLYTSRFPSVFLHCKNHCYADDTQVYLSFDPEDVDRACTTINNELSNLVVTSNNYGLNINPTKSKVMLFGRVAARNRIRDNVNIFLNNERLALTTESKNLGLFLDDRLEFCTHVTRITSKAFSILKLIYANRQNLNRNCRKILCESLVLSHLNYCDVIYGPNLRRVDSRRLQLIQNACARLTCSLRRGSHISGPIKQLGWLKIDKRRLLHSMVFFHKIIKEQNPPYLYEKISFRRGIHSINTRHKCLLDIPIHKTSQFRGSFSYQIAKIYNNLPREFKDLGPSTFKRQIKDWLLTDSE